MSTTFTPTPLAKLKRGDKMGHYPERIAVTPIPCDIHPGNLFTAIEGYGDSAGAHSDICAPPDKIFIVRTTPSSGQPGKGQQW